MLARHRGTAARLENWVPRLSLNMVVERGQGGSTRPAEFFFGRAVRPSSPVDRNRADHRGYGPELTGDASVARRPTQEARTMRRFTLCSSVAMVALIGAVGFAQTPSKIATLADHVAVMKSNGQANGALNKSLGSGSFRRRENRGWHAPGEFHDAASVLDREEERRRPQDRQRRRHTPRWARQAAGRGGSGSGRRDGCCEGVLRGDLRRVPQNDARGRQPDRIPVPPRRGPVQTTVGAAHRSPPPAQINNRVGRSSGNLSRRLT